MGNEAVDGKRVAGMRKLAGEMAWAGAAARPAAPPRAAGSLFFDATRFDRDDEDKGPARPPVPRPGEGLRLTILAVLLILLAVLPISAAGAGDLWRYLVD